MLWHRQAGQPCAKQQKRGRFWNHFEIIERVEITA